MKKLFLIMIFSLILGCAGYQPILSTNEVNFYIKDISSSSDDRILNQIVKKFTPYKKNNGKKEINLEISSIVSEKIISKDKKGDPSIYEMLIIMNVNILLPNDDNQKISFSEKISINNQTNKFEFKQYKNNLKKNAIDKIFEKIILKLRSL